MNCSAQFQASFSVLTCLQARKLRQHIQGLPDSLQLQAVVVSPLTRAIETAIGAFGGADWTQADSAQPLMLAQEAVEVLIIACRHLSQCSAFYASTCSISVAANLKDCSNQCRLKEQRMLPCHHLAALPSSSMRCAQAFTGFADQCHQHGLGMQ